jgi:hypothetical protein
MDVGIGDTIHNLRGRGMVGPETKTDDADANDSSSDSLHEGHSMLQEACRLEEKQLPAGTHSALDHCELEDPQRNNLETTASVTRDMRRK